MNTSLTEYKKYKEEMANKPALDLNNPAALAESKGCFSCHNVDVKSVGPLFKEVSTKNSEAAVSVKSMMNGSESKHDVIPMPPQDVSEDEAKKLATWILELKEAK